MRSNRLLCGAAALCLLASPAAAAITALNGGAPVAQANNSSGTGTSSLTATTTVAIPAGSLLVVLSAQHNTGVTGCSDGINGAYAAAGAQSGQNHAAQRTFYVVNSAALSSGTVITCTYSISNSPNALVMMAFTGAATSSALEGNVLGQTASSTAGAVSLGSVTAASAGDLVIYGMSLETTIFSYSGESAGFTTATSTSSNQVVHVGYEIVPTSGSYNPSVSVTGSSYALAWDVAAFAAGTAPSPSACNHGLMLLGAGSAC